MKTWLCLAAAIVLTVGGQSLQKQLALRGQSRRSAVLGWYVRQPLMWAAIAAMGLAMLSWLVVLDDMPVSKAYPLLGANYILMLAVARLVFGEAVPPRRWVGAGIVVAGLALVSAS